MCSYRAVLEQRSDELIKRRTCKEKTPQFFNTTACFECLSRESLSWQMIKAPCFFKAVNFFQMNQLRVKTAFFLFRSFSSAPITREFGKILRADAMLASACF